MLLIILNTKSLINNKECPKIVPNYIQLVWDLLKQTIYHINLYQSMPKRVSAVCLKKGGWGLVQILK